ncbi:NAD(P)H-dependent oxidoreductase [Niallia sp. 03133]|uniref:NAD(P)H-dependent oxidoreductase n=1 Tax=Niallia sp. 03133 TaxID=3458060 RepID=UPI0040450C03
MTKTIGLICGSLWKDSYNRIIAQALAKMADSIDFCWIETKDIPLYNEDYRKRLSAPFHHFSSLSK